jgi:hypothetical protein
MTKKKEGDQKSNKRLISQPNKTREASISWMWAWASSRSPDRRGHLYDSQAGLRCRLGWYPQHLQHLLPRFRYFKQKWSSLSISLDDMFVQHRNTYVSVLLVDNNKFIRSGPGPARCGPRAVANQTLLYFPCVIFYDASIFQIQSY